MSESAIDYQVVAARPEAHLFDISCRVSRPDPAGQVFSMAAWIPGSYMIRDFAKHIVRIRAVDGNGQVALQQLDKQTWRCEPSDGPLQIHYTVYAWDLSVRAAHLDTTHGFFNGTSLLIKVHGCEQAPCTVRIDRPVGEAHADWRLATAMTPVTVDETGFGSYAASGYDEVIDHPVEMGRFQRIEFEVAGIPHALVLTGRQYADPDRLRDDLQRICQHHVEFFGELPAMRNYVFLTMVVGAGYGGLEHRASCSLLCSRDDLPEPGMSGMPERYRDFLGLCSHEYFHTWNVKRIQPAAFAACDLSAEVHTRQLWIFEGITSYYDDLALARCGLITAEGYLELLGRTITRVLRCPGRFEQTLAESSFNAWTKFYKQDENAPNAIISYYTKGALAALALDLKIRGMTDGELALDDVMRVLWRDYGRVGVGLEEGDFERLVQDITGLDLAAFFELALRSTQDLPLQSLLATVGVHWSVRPALSPEDQGGKPATVPEPVLPGADLGVRIVNEGSEAKVAQVLDQSAAQQAGIAAGDVLIALDGLRLTRENYWARVRRHRAGQRLPILVFRGDELMSFDVILQPASLDTCVLSVQGDVDPATRRARTAWLGAAGLALENGAG